MVRVLKAFRLDPQNFWRTLPWIVFTALTVASAVGFTVAATVPESTARYVIGLVALALAVLAAGLMHLAQTRLDSDVVALRASAQSNHRLSTGFDNASIGMAILDSGGRVVKANRSMTIQLGRRDATLIGARLNDFVHRDDQPAQDDVFNDLSAGRASAAPIELRYVRADRSVVWVSQSISALGDVSDDNHHFMVQSLDTTARRAVEDELRHQARHDDLTGLPNREHLLEKAGALFAESRLSGEGVALLYVDLDRIKVVNDSLGHRSGDQVIKAIADRLTVAVDPAHFLARVGADEFALLCPGVEARGHLARVAGIIHREVRRPIQLDTGPVHTTASIGVTIGHGESDTPDGALRDADAAMYRAKDRGRNTTEFFDAGIRLAAVNRLDLEQQMRLAIERDEFDVHYQPVVDLRSNRVVGFEALLRWEHPELGTLLPGEFLDVADEAGLLDEIDCRTLARACSQFSDWSERSDVAAGWHLAVNCSSRWFHDGVVSGLLPGVLKESALDPSRLWLEVTETALLRDTRAAAESFDVLHDMGVKVAIDDFGTGFSSLSYLSRFKVDRLKIDQSFVQSLGTPADNAIVSAVVDMAAALGIATVAEGTESLEQLELLREMGADLAQGYLLSRPLSADDVEAALLTLA